MTRDKAFLDWHGRPLWRGQLDKLIALRPARLMVAARPEQNFAAQLQDDTTNPPLDLVCDPVGEDCGPLAAIARCLRRADGPLLVLAVDMPLMSVAFLRDSLLAQSRPEKGVVFEGANGYEALAAVYAPAALPFFENSLTVGHHALQPLIEEISVAGHCEVMRMKPEDAPLFANANTPNDAARLLGFQS